MHNASTIYTVVYSFEDLLTLLFTLLFGQHMQSPNPGPLPTVVTARLRHNLGFHLHTYIVIISPRWPGLISYQLIYSVPKALFSTR